MSLFILMFTVAVSALAEQRQSSTANEQREFFDFNRELVFPAGTRYAGERILLEEDRNIIRMTNAEIAASGFAKMDDRIDHTKYHYVANFRHKNKYWLARIPKSGVMSSVYQFQTISSLADKGVPKFIIDWLRMGHIQIRFKMKGHSPVVLMTQSLNEPTVKTTLWDFGYTLIATRSESQKGQSFDPVDEGRNAGYRITHNFASTKDFLEDFINANLDVEQHEINFSNEQNDELLQYFVNESADRMEDDKYSTYHALDNSCVTSVMDGIYSVVPNTRVIWYGRFWRNSKAFTDWLNFDNKDNPRAGVALLRKQGYMTDDSQINNLEIEFSNRQPFEMVQKL